MSVFKTDVPEIAYRFHIRRPDRTTETGYDLSVVWHRGVDNVLWCVRRGLEIVVQCNTHSAVEPLVRAWFMGDCIPGIVADFIEERGEGDQWLLRILRDDPDWHASVPSGGMLEGGWTTTTTAPTMPPLGRSEIQEMIDRLMEMRRQEMERSVRPMILPTVDWTYRPDNRHRWITNPHDRTGSGPVVISGPTE